jgi:predicted DNA binding CopG/RHH family protein
MKKIKLTKNEKEIEESLAKGEYIPITGKQLEMIKKSLQSRKKDVTMTIRVNSEDIEKIKMKAKKSGIKYQTYISEILHQVAKLE